MTRPPTFFVAALSLAALLSLGACVPTDPNAPASQVPPEAPPGAPLGTCWHRNTSPAVIETVTDQVMVKPAERDASGAVTRPAVFRTVTRQDIVQPRRDTWIETPCQAQITPEFIASLQRALEARGYYRGTPTGRMDRSTKSALRRYQKEAGLDSNTLSLDTARRLGLIAIAQ
ncbi:peptidoglycan-binding domain-containing protein [Pseudophaeobacter sp.]|uniref:peptidoglycan-binding domain-containing protein n=1 Tax=Pseudophaeobacter sp. TaxID=1971739 RepID=UPI0032990818